MLPGEKTTCSATRWEFVGVAVQFEDADRPTRGVRVRPRLGPAEGAPSSAHLPCQPFLLRHHLDEDVPAWELPAADRTGHVVSRVVRVLAGQPAGVIRCQVANPLLRLEGPLGACPGNGDLARTASGVERRMAHWRWSLMMGRRAASPVLSSIAARRASAGCEPCRSGSIRHGSSPSPATRTDGSHGLA